MKEDLTYHSHPQLKNALGTYIVVYKTAFK